MAHARRSDAAAAQCRAGRRAGCAYIAFMTERPVDPDPPPDASLPPRPQPDAPVLEDGGPKGLEPTRYGDWERKGIAVDF